MATAVAPPFPSSLQLRFSHRSPKPSQAFCKTRLRPSILRIRSFSAGGDGGGQSWAGNGRSKDSFAGWTGSEGGGGDPNKDKDRYGGMLGAGLAGVFFTAGIAFASLSLCNKNSTGAKQKMEPLTTEQEVMLTSGDQMAKSDQVGNGSTVMLFVKQSKTDDCNSEYHKGVNKDLPSHIENTEDSETSSMEHTKSNANDVEANLNNSSQDHVEIDPDVNENPVPSTSSPITASEITSDDIFSSPDASGMKAHVAEFSDSDNLPTEDDPNQSSIDLCSLSVDSTTQINDQLEDISTVDRTLDVSNEVEAQLQVKLSASSPIGIESGDIVGSPGCPDERVDIAAADFKREETEANTLNVAVHDILKTVQSGPISGNSLDQNEAMVLPKEPISATRGYLLKNNGPSVAFSADVLAVPGDNVSDIGSESQIGRSSTVVSALSEKPLSYAGIPAPSLVSESLQVPPGKVLIPAVVDHVQRQALIALQVLKVIEADAQPGDLCTRREYARWLVSASSALSRNTISKVYPAMYIEDVTELAFDDVTPEDPDYSCIQGLAEAGIISSNLSESDLKETSREHRDSFFFSPESPVSRQDLVSWKMALERRELPEVDRNHFYQCSGYIDIDKIDKDAWPALVADLSAGEQGITALAFGYTRLFQPNKPVTKAQAAIALATGDSADIVEEELTRIEAESLAETAVNAHTALVAQVEKELNASFEAELAKEKEKTNSLEKFAEEARLELQRLRAEREEENNTLISRRAAIESEIEVLSRLRHEVEQQLQDLMSGKVEIAFERERINKLRIEAESENQLIVQLQYELEVEKKALSMARSWAEEEAKRAREQAKVLEEARDRWERHGIKVVVDRDLQEDASAGVTWLTAGQQHPADETINRAETLVKKLKTMASEMKIKSSAAIGRIIQKILALISTLKAVASKTSEHAIEFKSSIVSKASRSVEELKETVSVLSSSIGDRTRRAVEDCKDGVDKLTQKFKT